MAINSWTPFVLTLTGVTVSGGNAVYAYSSFTGTAPAINNLVQFSGFTASGGVNNTTGFLTAVSGGASGTVTIVHAGVNETHAGVGTQQQFIQGAVANSISYTSSPWTATLTGTKAGNVLFAFAFWDNNRTATATIVDTAGNTWTLLQHAVGALANIRANVSMYLWFCVSVGGTTAITVTPNIGSNGDLGVYEWQGPLLLDQIVAAYSPGTTTDPVLGPSVTTSFADEEAIAFFLMVSLPSGITGGFSSVGPVISTGITPSVAADATSIGTYTPGYHDNSGFGCGCITTSWLRGTLTPEVDVAEVQISITYQNPGNYLYARDVDSWGDGGTFGQNNGTPYAVCNVVIGSITMSQPGAPLFPLQHVVGYFDAVGTLNNGGSSYPDVWILPNEISDKKGIGFIQLPEVVQEPPEGQNHPSTSMLALRWPVNMMNSELASQFVHHLQVKIQFEPENAPNTLKAIAFKESQE